ncbi:MAG: hypothetical protein KC468_08285, partial [Myxococcales bacterium]|nr:hypothetical protein [Myxococcales bacterium]
RVGLGAKGLVTLEQERGTLVAVRGSLHGARDIPLDLRARGSDELGWDVRVELGVVGRERPRLELRPDPRVEPGQHSPLITTRHRVVGDTRTLEIYDEGLFDALARFPDHRARFWDAGVSVELGRDLAALDPDALEELITQLARAC